MTSRQARAERTGRSVPVVRVTRAERTGRSVPVVRVTRNMRREQERKARKAAKKAGLHALAAPAPPLPEVPLEEEFSPEFLAQARAVRERIAYRVTTASESVIRPPKAENSVAAQTESSTPREFGFVSQNAPIPENRRAAINRANAAHSTGPRSSTGKLASSRNSFKHGLASGQLIIAGEDRGEFDSLLQSLLAEHQPANTTEEILVHEMAQSFWLTQRALRLQNDCFTADGIDQKRLSLFLRYHTTHERAFHKALNMLIRLQKARKNEFTTPRGFVSQHSQASAAIRLDEPAHLSQAKTEPVVFVPQTASHRHNLSLHPGESLLPLPTSKEIQVDGR